MEEGARQNNHRCSSSAMAQQSLLICKHHNESLNLKLLLHCILYDCSIFTTRCENTTRTEHNDRPPSAWLVTIREWSGLIYNLSTMICNINLLEINIYLILALHVYVVIIENSYLEHIWTILYNTYERVMASKMWNISRNVTRDFYGVETCK